MKEASDLKRPLQLLMAIETRALWVLQDVPWSFQIVSASFNK